MFTLWHRYVQLHALLRRMHTACNNWSAANGNWTNFNGITWNTSFRPAEDRTLAPRWIPCRLEKKVHTSAPQTPTNRKHFLTATISTYYDYVWVWMCLGALANARFWVHAMRAHQAKTAVDFLFSTFFSSFNSLTFLKWKKRKKKNRKWPKGCAPPLMFADQKLTQNINIDSIGFAFACNFPSNRFLEPLPFREST